MTRANPHEAAARARKVARLTRHITELVSWLGLTPEADGHTIAELIRGWGDREWAQAAINVGSAGASVTTRLAVLEHFTSAERKAS